MYSSPQPHLQFHLIWLKMAALLLSLSSTFFISRGSAHYLSNAHTFLSLPPPTHKLVGLCILQTHTFLALFFFFLSLPHVRTLCLSLSPGVWPCLSMCWLSLCYSNQLDRTALAFYSNTWWTKHKNTKHLLSVGQPAGHSANMDLNSWWRPHQDRQQAQHLHF